MTTARRTRRIPAYRLGDSYLPAVTLTTVTLESPAWLGCGHKVAAGASVLRAVAGVTTVHYCDAACRSRSVGGAK